MRSAAASAAAEAGVSSCGFSAVLGDCSSFCGGTGSAFSFSVDAAAAATVAAAAVAAAAAADGAALLSADSGFSCG